MKKLLWIFPIWINILLFSWFFKCVYFLNQWFVPQLYIRIITLIIRSGVSLYFWRFVSIIQIRKRHLKLDGLETSHLVNMTTQQSPSPCCTMALYRRRKSGISVRFSCIDVRTSLLNNFSTVEGSVIFSGYRVVNFRTTREIKHNVDRETWFNSLHLY
jgi:hypothetical protein